MSALPCIEREIEITGESVKIYLPENAVQVFDREKGKFVPLVQAFDVEGTVSESLHDGSYYSGLVQYILSGWRDWYRVPTETAFKSIFPDTEHRRPDGSMKPVRNVVQERTDSPNYAVFRARQWVIGREAPVMMTLHFPAVYRGAVHISPEGGYRIWRDIMMPDGRIIRSLGALIIEDLLTLKGFLFRRAEYLSDEEIQARWQQRIDRVVSGMYLGEASHEDVTPEQTQSYSLSAAEDTIRLLRDQDELSVDGHTLAHARLRKTQSMVAKLLVSGEIDDPLHTPSGTPCRMFYRPWSERPDDGEPVQLWKHPLSKMVNPARIRVLAGDVHCLPLAGGPHHRIMVKGFPHYNTVNTRDLLGVGCDIPGVLGDGVIISEKAAQDLSVIIEEWQTLTPDELINARQQDNSGVSALRRRKPTPIILPSPGGDIRRWRLCTGSRIRKIRVGDKLQSGTIKGVVNRILPVEEMPKVVQTDGSPLPADIIFSWRHWQKWGALSEVCRAQLAYWCATEDEPLVVEHGEIPNLQTVQSSVESAGGGPDLTLPVLFPGDTECQHVYSGYFPVGVREQLVEVQSQESRLDSERMRCSVDDPLHDPLAYLLAPDRVSSRGVRLGYADIFCLMDDYPEMTEWLLGFSNGFRLREIAGIIKAESD